MTLMALPTKVAAAAMESHSNTSFCECVTSSLTWRLTKLRVGSVAGRGLPPGPRCVGVATFVFELEATMLRVVKAARKKSSMKMG